MLEVLSFTNSSHWKVTGHGAMAQTITTYKYENFPNKLTPEVAKIILEEAIVYEKAAVKDGQKKIYERSY